MMMIVIGPLSYVAHVACRQAFMIKCAIYCDFTWSLWLFQWASLQTVCMLICEYPHPYSHSHSHTRTQRMLYFTVILIYGNFMRVRSNVRESSRVRVRPESTLKSDHIIIIKAETIVLSVWFMFLVNCFIYELALCIVPQASFVPAQPV